MIQQFRYLQFDNVIFVLDSFIIHTNEFGLSDYYYFISFLLNIEFIEPRFNDGIVYQYIHFSAQ